MALASRTLRNSILVVVARGLAKVAVFAVVVMLFGHLGDVRYGMFSAMVVYVTLAGVVADLGFQTVFVRDISRNRAEFDRYLATLLSARLLLGVLGLALLAAALRLLSPQLYPFTVAGFVLLISTSYSSLLRSVFYIRGRLIFEAIAIVGESIILLTLAIYAVRHNASWDVFLWVYSASYLFTCLFTLGIMRLLWHDSIVPGFEPRLLRHLIAAGFPVALGFTLAGIYTQVDVVLLQVLKNFEQVGWYSAANRYIDAIVWIPQSAMGAVFPVLSLLAGGGRDKLAVAYEKSYRMLAIIAVPLSVGIGLTSDLLVHATPHAFLQSIPALRILSISVAFLFLNNAFVYTLTAMNRQADFTRLTLVALIVNLGLNFALIPPYGYQGAAAAATLTEVCLFLGGWWLVRRRLYGLPAVRTIGRVLLAGLFMGAAILVLHSTSLLVIVPAAAAVYVVALLVFKALDPMEIQIVRQAFRAG